MHKTVVVIPTYWKKGPYTSEDALYDHPTDLDNPKDTLSRTLNSLTKLDGKFSILVLGISTRYSIGEEMDKKITNIISSLNITQETIYFGHKAFMDLRKRLSKEIQKNLINLVSNQGYGNVRNLCIFLPYLLNFEVAILIDDDEIIPNKKFMDNATEFIGKVTENDKVLGLVLGFYRNKDGSVLIDETQTPWWEQLFWNKNALMNQSFEIIDRTNQPRLVPTSFALGGNMVIYKDCFTIPFDPLVSRGEDMDYLRNIQYFGFDAKLDRSLSVIHLPPKTDISYVKKFQQDIRRFVYSYFKSTSMKIIPNKYDPYPGYFLKQIEGKILMTELLYYIFQNHEQFYNVKNQKELILKIQEFPSILSESISKYKQQKDSYLRFQKEWEKLLFLIRNKNVGNVLGGIKIIRGEERKT
jgi:hypothetical protein